MATSFGNRSFVTAAARATVVMLFLTLLSMAHAQLSGTVAIGNSFQSPTQFSCSSNVRTRPTYTATSNEIYYFAFDTDKQQFWDCEVHNVAYGKSGMFRFWGDEWHGGSELWSCFHCKWNVDQFGISLYVNNQWQYHYFWRSTSSETTTTGHRKLL